MAIIKRQKLGKNEKVTLQADGSFLAEWREDGRWFPLGQWGTRSAARRALLDSRARR